MKKTIWLCCRLTILLSIFVLTNCTSLLTPNRTTEPHELRSGNYQIDKTHARVLFKVKHLALSTYVGRFNDFDATLDFNSDALSSSFLEATVSTGSLDLNDDELETTLRNSDWFNSARFPEAVFTTLSVEPINDSQLNFKGNLTMLGVTKPVDMLIDFHGGATNLLTGKYTIGFSAIGTLKRSDFGMDQYRGLVSDKVSIEVYAEFQRLWPTVLTKPIALKSP